MKKYIIFLLTYLSLSIASMFLTTKPIELFTLFDVAVWIPLSALTLVSLVRCFSGSVLRLMYKGETL